MKLTTSETKRKKVVKEIIKNIYNGVLSPGARLATIRSMSSAFGTSLSVVQKALYELSADGFVECCGSSGYYVSQNIPPKNKVQAEKKSVSKPTGGGKIHLMAMHHSDLVWRYTYEEYNKIREEQIQHELDLAKRYPQFHFGIEQAEILRVYLSEHPEDKEIFKSLCKEGRLEIFGGLCIPDLNLVCGESIARNLIIGRRMYERLLGITPAVCCLSDAFGMSVQLPQILSKCGFTYLLPGRMPNRPADMKASEPFVWCGPDCSTVTTICGVQNITHLGYNCNLPEVRSEDEQLANSLSALKYAEGNQLVHYMTEEGLIKEELFWILEDVNKQPGRNIQFGRTEDYFKNCNADELPVFYGEFNPTFTGCYTTRSRVKQAIRRAENNLFAAEFFNIIEGGERDYEELWRELLLTQFHDAACGCHSDLANEAIMSKLQRVNNETSQTMEATEGATFGICSFSKFTGDEIVSTTQGLVPEGVESQLDDDGRSYFAVELPFMGIRNFRKSKKKASAPRKCSPKFRTDFYEVDFSSPYPVIENLKGENVFGSKYFGEIQYRVDYGTMWTEDFKDTFIGHERESERVISVVEGPVFFKAITEGEVLYHKPNAGNLGNQWPGFESLKFKKEYYFPKHQDFFKLRVTLDWKGNNTKIGISFPLDIKVANSSAIYDVPFGTIIRKPYFEVQSENKSTLQTLTSQGDYVTAKGDWPALNYVNYSDLQKGLTIANNGTPGHQLVNGNIIISLLRSGTALRDGAMMPQTGSFDNGRHEYEFLFCAHSPMEMDKAAHLGQMLNRPARICKAVKTEGSLIDINCKNIQISAIYQEDDKIILRLYETLGREIEATLSGAILQNRKIYETDMIGTDPIPQEATMRFCPFEIKTLILK